jgi:methyl-accepting chemotaxis protein
MKSSPEKKLRRAPGAPAKGLGKAKRKTLRSKKSTTDAPLLSSAQVVLLRRSFNRIAPQSGIAAMIFYRNLFTLDPSLRSLFHTTIELQGRKFMDSLEYTVASLENPRALIPALEAMGRRHVTYGTKPEHYETVIQAMLQTLGETLGKNFTPPVAKAWRRALGFVCAAMQRGAREVEELTAGKSSNFARPSAVKDSRSVRR